MKNKQRVRQRVKVMFIYLNKELFIEHEKLTLLEHKDWKFSPHRTDYAKKIISLARQQIGYSTKTSDVDLFRTLMGLYNLIMQSGLPADIFLKHT